MSISSRRLLLALASLVAMAACAPSPKQGGAYEIFFSNDSAELTQDAQKLISDAAKEAETRKARSVTIDGFASTQGPRDTHEALSAKRAEVVAKALEANGVPATLIHRVEGHGDAGALPDVTVGERRVEIRLAY